MIESIIKKFNEHFAIATFAIYVVGFLVYGSWFGSYSHYLILEPLKLEYLTAGLWWLSFNLCSIGTYHLVYKHLNEGSNESFLSLWKKRMSNPIALILSVLSLLLLLILLKIFRYPELIRSILMPWVIKELTGQFFYKQFLMFTLFAFSVYFLVLEYIKYKEQKIISSLTLIILVLNLSFFAHGPYSMIPRSLGGGELDHVSVVFQKGYLPTDLFWITKEPYSAAIIDEDSSVYYLVFFRHKWWSLRWSGLFGQGTGLYKWEDALG